MVFVVALIWQGRCKLQDVACCGNGLERAQSLRTGDWGGAAASLPPYWM